MMVSELGALAERITRNIAVQGRYFVATPSEMAQIGDLEHAHRFAREHHWMLVNHLDGTNYEFFETTDSPQQDLW